MKTFIKYLIIALASYFVSSYFVGCNAVKKSSTEQKSNVDSSNTKAKDSSTTAKRDSTNVQKQSNADEKNEKHIDNRSIIVDFDTAAKTFNNVTPYKYDVNGNVIASPQPISSATFSDNDETDSSSNDTHKSNDSVRVQSLDSSNISKGEQTILQKQTKSVVTTKQTSRFPWELIIVGIIVVIAGGYIVYRKYFPL